MPARKYDHDAVLDLWAAGFSSLQIGQRLGMPHETTAQVIVLRAGRRGDPRASRRRLLVGGNIFADEAERRGVTVAHLKSQLLAVIANNPEVIDLLLDDGGA